MLQKGLQIFVHVSYFSLAMLSSLLCSLLIRKKKAFEFYLHKNPWYLKYVIILFSSIFKCGHAIIHEHTWPLTNEHS